jgi:hypothetical protein
LGSLLEPFQDGSCERARELGLPLRDGVLGSLLEPFQDGGVVGSACRSGTVRGGRGGGAVE